MEEHGRNRKRRPVLALVATPKFKQDEGKSDELRRFVLEHLYWLTSHFQVISTGRTHDAICGWVDRDYSRVQRPDIKLIETSIGRAVSNEKDLAEWREPIRRFFKTRKPGVAGMIEIANELVQGRLNAVIQFSMEDDTTVRAGSAVLRREANVHDVPIASDVPTAHSFVRLWKKQLKTGKLTSLSPPPKITGPAFKGLKKSQGNEVLALIAHDGRKEEMCRFVVEHRDHLGRFTHILTTATTGKRVREILGIAGWKPAQLDRIKAHRSGPKGGDVEIAAAVIGGYCHNVIFFQDPATSHPHEADIRLFEQAILAGDKVRLATNARSARILLEAI